MTIHVEIDIKIRKCFTFPMIAEETGIVELADETFSNMVVIFYNILIVKDLKSRPDEPT